MSSYLDTPSSPLSMRSRSPTPPLGYPSPAPSYAELVSRSTTPFQSVGPQYNEMNDTRPTKRRRLNEPKERATSRLDLKNFHTNALSEDENIQLERLMHNIRNKQKIVVIAGAGISVSAGIPDFRSSNGLFTTLKGQHNLKSSGKHLFDASVYKDDDSTTSFHSMVRDLSHMTREAEPTPFHHLLATLAAENRLLRLYSQNVDGIDTSMEPLATQIPLPVKGPWPRTIQLHGGLDKMVCTKCGELSSFKGYLFQGPEPPSCVKCEEIDQIRTEHLGRRSHGIGKLRPRMVLYNEFNPDQEAIGAVSAADLRSRPDAVLVVGTTLKVPGIRRIAREMCQVTRGRRDGFTAWINYDPEPVGTEFKDCWDLIVRGSCDDVAQFVKLPRWDDTNIGDFRTVSLEEVEQAKAKGGIKLELPNKTVARVQGMVTPTPSPRKHSPVPLLIKGEGRQLTFVKTPTESVTVVEKKKKRVPATKKSRPTKTTIAKTKNRPASISQAFSVSKVVSQVVVKKGEKLNPSTTINVPQEIPESPPTATTTVTQETVIRKPASRKRSRTVKAKMLPIKGQSNIGDAFSTSKVTSTSITPAVEAFPSPASTIEVVTSTMQPISFLDLRNNSEPSTQLYHEQSKHEATLTQSQSPYKKEAYTKAQRETISPKSVPRAMTHLID